MLTQLFKRDSIELKIVEEYIKGKLIFHFNNLDNNNSQHMLCRAIIHYTSNLYIENRTLNNTAKKLNIPHYLLRKFLIHADKINVINYHKLKLKSKRSNRHHKDFNISQFIKQDLYKQINKKDIKKNIMKIFKKSGNIKKTSKLLNISSQKLRDILLSKYKCNSIPKLKKKLNIIPEKKINKIKKVKDMYDRCLSLQKVADKLQITKERVRQILREGEKHGLFRYELHYGKDFNKLMENILGLT